MTFCPFHETGDDFGVHAVGDPDLDFDFLGLGLRIVRGHFDQRLLATVLERDDAFGDRENTSFFSRMMTSALAE
jgi:hypothetical protein